MERTSDPSAIATVAVQVASVSLTSSSSSIVEEGRFVPGTLLVGRYRIIALLGRGGMGEVYRATDLTLGQSVALKFLPADASRDVRLLERFHGEVRMARQVPHPNVCRVYDIGEVEGTPFLSMELGYLPFGVLSAAGNFWARESMLEPYLRVTTVAPHPPASPGASR